MRKLIAWILLLHYLAIFGGDVAHHIENHEVDTCADETQHICDSEFEFHPCLLCVVNHEPGISSNTQEVKPQISGFWNTPVVETQPLVSREIDCSEARGPPVA